MFLIAFIDEVVSSYDIGSDVNHFDYSDHSNHSVFGFQPQVFFLQPLNFMHKFVVDREVLQHLTDLLLKEPQVIIKYKNNIRVTIIFSTVMPRISATLEKAPTLE